MLAQPRQTTTQKGFELFLKNMCISIIIFTNLLCQRFSKDIFSHLNNWMTFRWPWYFLLCDSIAKLFSKENSNMKTWKIENLRLVQVIGIISLFKEFFRFMRLNFPRMTCKQGHALKSWVEGLSDEAFYPWESPKKIELKSVNPFFTEQKKVLIHW